MRVIRNERIIDDGWRLLQEPPQTADELPQGPVIVPLAWWQERRTMLAARVDPIGVRIGGGDPLEEIAADLKSLPLVALEFEKFSDGRSFSHARMLRRDYGYRGELRAVGDVLPDQLFFMRRCGIDSFQLDGDRDPEEALHALKEISVTYQSAADGATPVYRLRHSSLSA